MYVGASEATGETEFCPVYAAIELLQEKWTLHIVRSLLEAPKGFNELARAVGGCNPSTLAQRLAALEAAGVVSKTIYSTMPPRTSYRLTAAGVALEQVIGAIDAWARRYTRHSGPNSMVGGE